MPAATASVPSYEDAVTFDATPRLIGVTAGDILERLRNDRCRP